MTYPTTHLKWLYRAMAYARSMYGRNNLTPDNVMPIYDRLVEAWQYRKSLAA